MASTATQSMQGKANCTAVKKVKVKNLKEKKQTKKHVASRQRDDVRHFFTTTIDCRSLSEKQMPQNAKKKKKKIFSSSGHIRLWYWHILDHDSRNVCHFFSSWTLRKYWSNYFTYTVGARLFFFFFFFFFWTILRMVPTLTFGISRNECGPGAQVSPKMLCSTFGVSRAKILERI